VLAGGGRFAVNLGEILEELGYTIVGYTDVKSTGLRWSYLGDDHIAGQGKFPENTFIVIAVGTSIQLREQLFKHWSGFHLPLLTFIHPQAFVSRCSEVSEGCILFPQSYVGPNVVLKQNVVLCSGAIVEHDTVIGEHSYLAPGAVINGSVTVGEKCMFGSNSTVVDGVQIADEVVVGAASLVLHSVSSSRSTLVGVPGRILPTE